MINIEDLPQRYQELARSQMAAEDAAKRPGQVELASIAAQVPAASEVKPVALERELHDDIILWANSQKPWPWKYIHARMDRESTIEEGAADFTLFGPWPLCIVIEAKARQEKQKPKQLTWAAEMSRLGWKVHVARCMEEVRQIAEEENVRMIMR